jgi:protein-S-isoprenylcysteine O-methyltransferase Ste14
MSKHNSGLHEVLEGKLLQDSPLVSAASKVGRLSQHFGVPVLIAFLLGPQDVSQRDSLMIYFLFALPAGLSSLILRWWTFGYVRGKDFVINGPYRYVRNPAELACVLAYSAGGVLLRLPAWYILSIVAISILYMSFVSIAYEHKLIRLYGSQYVRYAQRVRRWIPASLPAANALKQNYELSRAVLFDVRWWLWLLGYLLVFAYRYRNGPLLEW